MHSIGWVVELDDTELRSAVLDLASLLTDAGHAVRGDGEADVVVVWADRPLSTDVARRIARPDVRSVLAGPTLRIGDPDGALGEAAGVYVSGTTPVHDLRLRGGDTDRPSLSGHQHSEGDHVGRHDHLIDRVALVDKTAADVHVLRSAMVGLTRHPVTTWRPSTATGSWTLGTLPGSVDSRVTALALLELLQLASSQSAPPAVRVGLLGYGAIGHEHSRAVRAVDGLELGAVCDTSQARLDAASAAVPGIVTTVDAEALIARDDVDLVVVSTPPSTHAEWALRAVRAGKHVILEKPFAIETSEADAVMAEAVAYDRLVAVYQNRRFDPDHLAVRRAIASGALGEVFHVETFVGGYGHPCNLWHSDARVSGGAFYDWGSHVLDQILDLLPGEIEHVTAATHKRRWFDVTNADHSRVTIRFADGVEAEFVHSDLAAALKPRWYVLGTSGAIVGNWRTEKVVSRTDIGTLTEDVFAPADSPPLLDLHAADGSVTRLAAPAADPYQFHHEVAARLRFGLPMTVTAAQSRRVLSVMEAARASACDSSRPVVPR